MANIQSYINQFIGFIGSNTQRRAIHKALLEKFVSWEVQTLTIEEKNQAQENLDFRITDEDFLEIFALNQWLHVLIHGYTLGTCLGGEAGTEPGFDPEIPVYGEKGDSAYQVAVDNGFVGTEAQWLAALKGEQGEGIGDHETTYNHDNFVTTTEMNEVLGDILTILNSI